MRSIEKVCRKRLANSFVADPVDSGTVDSPERRLGRGLIGKFPIQLPKISADNQM